MPIASPAIVGRVIDHGGAHGVEFDVEINVSPFRTVIAAGNAALVCIPRRFAASNTFSETPMNLAPLFIAFTLTTPVFTSVSVCVFRPDV